MEKRKNSHNSMSQTSDGRYSFGSLLYNTSYGRVLSATDTKLKLDLLAIILSGDEIPEIFYDTLDVRDVIHEASGTVIIFKDDYAAREYCSSISVQNGTLLKKAAKNHKHLYTALIAGVLTVAAATVIIINCKNRTADPSDTDISAAADADANESDVASGNVNASDDDTLQSDDIDAGSEDSEDAEEPYASLMDYDQDDYYLVFLNPSGINGESDLDSDFDIIKDRLTLTFGEDSYEASVSNGIIRVLVSKQCLKDRDMVKMIFNRFIDPQGIKFTAHPYHDPDTGLYVTDQHDLTGSEYSVSIVNGGIPGFDVMSYLADSSYSDTVISDPDSYPHVEVTFSQDYINELSADDSDYFTADEKYEFIVGNYSEGGRITAYRTFNTDSADTFALFAAFAYSYNDEAYTGYALNALKAMLETPALSTAYNMQFPFQDQDIDWFNEDTAVKYGENQCSIEDMKYPYSIASYDFSYCENKGQEIDVYSALTERLDILGVPYAMGIREIQDGKNIVLAINNTGVGLPVFQLVSSLNTGATIWSGNYYFPSGFEYSMQSGDDGYSLVCEYGDEYRDKIEEYTEKMIDEGNAELYFSVDDNYILKTDITSPVTDGKIIFDTISFEGTYDENIMWELIESVISGSQVSEETGFNGYASYDFTISNEEALANMDVSTYTLPSSCTELISKLCPDSRVEYNIDPNATSDYANNYNVYIYLNLDMTEETPSLATDIIQQIYEASDFEKVPYFKTMTFHVVNEDITTQENSILSFAKADRALFPEDDDMYYRTSYFSNDRFSFYMGLSDDETSDCSVYVAANFFNGRIDEYSDAFRQAFETDEFINGFNKFDSSEYWAFVCTDDHPYAHSASVSNYYKFLQ